MFLRLGLALTITCLQATETAVEVVQRQVDAYNAHDLEAFVACYAEGVEFLDLAGNKMGDPGLAALRKDYGALFGKNPKLRVHILKRIAQGFYVIDQERVEGMGAEPMTGTAIYEVAKGKIVKVWFL